LIKETIGFAILFPTSAFFGSLVVLVHVLEFLFALLGASVIPKLCHLPDAQGEDKMKKKNNKERGEESVFSGFILSHQIQLEDKG